MSSNHPKNEQYFVAELPQGEPTTNIWQAKEIPYPAIVDGGIVVKAVNVSVDPYLRGRLYSAKVGDAQVSGTVAQVVESKNDLYKVGAFVHGYLPWARYTSLSGDALKELRIVDPELAPVSTANGVLGMPGMTAYFGLLDIGELKEGDTVVVSGAAGAVGSLVGQIAKLKKCRVIGIVGTKDKVNYITKDLGFDVGINYKDYPTHEAMSKALATALINPERKESDSVQVFFDNTGGYVSDAVFDHIGNFARIVICGQISQYNELDKPVLGPRVLYKLIYKNATIKGFVVSRFLNRTKEFLEQMSVWVRNKQIKYHETELKGFESLPAAFVGLLKGDNIGKMIVNI